MAFGIAGAVVILQLFNRLIHPTLFMMQDFCQQQVARHVPAVSPSVAVYGSANGAGDGGGPFQTAQVTQNNLAGNAAQVGARFGPNGWLGGVSVNFDVAGVVDQHYTAPTG